MLIRDIVIIGGGAAGLMAAAKASDSGLSVVVVEKNTTCGRKLLLTGKGRCNITNMNTWDEFSSHIHPGSAFLKNAFFDFSNVDVLSFFGSIGLKTKVERGNRAFPASDRSQDVLNALLAFLKKRHVSVLNGTEVLSVKNVQGLYNIEVMQGCYLGREKVREFITTDAIISRCVILATGGLSYPLTGSTGDGYVFAKKLGHKIVPQYPSLTALVPDRYYSGLAGIHLKNVRLDLIENGQVVQSEFGELDFTDAGVEGALGFRVSRRAVKAISDGQKVEINIDLKPAVSSEQLAARITRNILPGTKLKTILNTLLPFELAPHYIAMNPEVTVVNLPVKLKNWRFTIKSFVGYERCVITTGGVDFGMVSRKTMQSKIMPGLFFAGEILDLDGDTGGYNLQIAFSTAALAAKSAISYVKSQSDTTVEGN